jgi:predicted DNA-binding transcriptional regulator AlpA
VSLSEAVDSPHEDAGTRRWWSVREIAEDLCISLNTVYKWSSRGEPWFPHSIRLANGEKRVRGDWYQEWLAGLELPGRVQLR